ASRRGGPGRSQVYPRSAALSGGRPTCGAPQPRAARAGQHTLGELGCATRLLRMRARELERSEGHCATAVLFRDRPRRSRPRSARLLDAAARHRLGSHELRVLPVPEVIAGAEWTEFAGEGPGRADEVLGVDIHSHEHVMAGQPAPRDDLRHRTPPLYNTIS